MLNVGSTKDFKSPISGWLFSATKVVNPLFALLDVEFAHKLAVTAAVRGWVPREKRPDPQILGLEVWGRKFSNPIGLAAGFDKNAEATEDAYKKIRAGATLVQLYTGFAYGGPALIPQIKEEVVCCLERDGFKSIQEAIGADHR
ncbi:dihydroorotate dehydrogenase (quinone), mitochondrial-like isoform X2 [Brassica napus]|nr:PREDICTED: dihydroorotate dehydrogenase (quinone), mitochondrial-like isoform X2 [Brassica oleracea var. oleracea]XP_013659824.1 dihydroorotate dehydrogenase (quinone), mitochondrial-like isoform X2 [Brassica napus]